MAIGSRRVSGALTRRVSHFTGRSHWLTSIALLNALLPLKSIFLTLTIGTDSLSCLRQCQKGHIDGIMTILGHHLMNREEKIARPDTDDFRLLVNLRSTSISHKTCIPKLLTELPLAHPELRLRSFVIHSGRGPLTASYSVCLSILRQAQDRLDTLDLHKLH